MLTGRAARYSRRGQVECGFRVVDGQLPGLTGRWRHGVATLGLKEIAFVGTVGGLRFLKRRPVRFAVEHVDRSDLHQPTGLELLSVNPAASVVRLTTPSAILEWAVVGQVPWAIERLTGGPLV